MERFARKCVILLTQFSGEGGESTRVAVYVARGVKLQGDTKKGPTFILIIFHKLFLSHEQQLRHRELRSMGICPVTWLPASSVKVRRWEVSVSGAQ